MGHRITSSVPDQVPQSLPRKVGALGVFAISSGAMISSGIFVLPGVAFERSGPAMILAYGLAGFVALIGTFSVVELATAMPRAGGDYFFVTRSLGPLVGSVSGNRSSADRHRPLRSQASRQRQAVGCDSESPTGPAWVPHVKIAPQVGQSSQHPVCLRVERVKNPITFRPTDSVGLDRG